MKYYRKEELVSQLAAGCSSPGCDCKGEMYIHAVCHPYGQIDAKIIENGNIEIGCRECGNPIVGIEVANVTPVTV